MANWCSIQKPAGWTSTGYAWATSYVGCDASGVCNPATFYNAVRNPSDTNPVVFDADKYAIVCEAFPSAGGTGDGPIANAARITELETGQVNLANQIAAITPWSAASDAGGYATTELQLEYFGAVLAFLVVVFLADRIRRFFWRDGGDHV